MKKMGYRGGRGRGRYPGRGPFRDLPPWQRPGRLYGYPVGYGYAGDPSKCASFPWMPRWWWTRTGETPLTVPAQTPEQERQYLEEIAKSLEGEIESIKKRLEEIVE